MCYVYKSDDVYLRKCACYPLSGLLHVQVNTLGCNQYHSSLRKKSERENIHQSRIVITKKEGEKWNHGVKVELTMMCNRDLLTHDLGYAAVCASLLVYSFPQKDLRTDNRHHNHMHNVCL